MIINLLHILCFRFNRILAAKSFAYLRVVFEEYDKISKRGIEKAIQSEMSGDLLQSMLAIGEFFVATFLTEDIGLTVDETFASKLPSSMKQFFE